MKGVAMVLCLASSSLLAAACGTGAVPPAVAGTGATTQTTSISSPRAKNGASQYGDEIKYATCMRTHGVPNFPDPSASGGFALPPGTNIGSPAYQAAQSKCQKILPSSGFPGPGTTTHPTSAALARVLKITQCMRRHGFPQFPDPTTSVPSNQSNAGQISDRNGVILVFPRSLDMQSPQFTRAAAVCKFSLVNH